MSGRIFLDTNIFVYAYDTKTARKKHITATELLRSIGPTDEAVISTQVVQEFCNVAFKKLPDVSAEKLTRLLHEVLYPMVAHHPDEAFYSRAIALKHRYKLAWYDTLLVQAASDMHCKTLYTEDLQDGQHFGSLTVLNPFHP
jgi:predicted nucleic acid-binding protein